MIPAIPISGGRAMHCCQRPMVWLRFATSLATGPDGKTLGIRSEVWGCLVCGSTRAKVVEWESSHGKRV